MALTGHELFERAVQYLESKGFDIDIVFIEGREYWRFGSIGLDYRANEISISVFDQHPTDTSPKFWIGGDFMLIRRILDVLIFAIESGAEE